MKTKVYSRKIGVGIINLIVSLFFGSSIFYAQNTTQVFDTPGTYTWTVPACVTSITVDVWGGGGGGGAVWSRFDPTDNGSFSAEACTAAGGGCLQHACDGCRARAERGVVRR